MKLPLAFIIMKFDQLCRFNLLPSQQSTNEVYVLTNTSPKLSK
jgi:hypothetical protein